MSTDFVRLARTGDEAAMTAVAVAAWRAMPWLAQPEDSESMADIRRSWEELLGDDSTPVDALVATTDDSVAGWLLLGHPDLTLPGGCCEVLDIVVEPAQQRRGHGSRLMHAAADRARTAGAAWLSMWCPLPDEPRRSFLIAHGFAPDGALRDLGNADDIAGLREVRLLAHLEQPASGS